MRSQALQQACCHLWQHLLRHSLILACQHAAEGLQQAKASLSQSGSITEMQRNAMHMLSNMQKQAHVETQQNTQKERQELLVLHREHAILQGADNMG